MNYQYNSNVDNGLRWMEKPYEPVGRYTAKTFGWMALGLLATFGTAYAFYALGFWQVLYSVPALPFILAIAELFVVFYLSARIGKISVGTAKGLFFAYAILNGFTFASFFVLYDMSSLVWIFALTAIYFAVLAAYGYFTKRDLAQLRPLLTFGLVFLMIFWVVSIFLPMSGFERIACFIGLAVFMGYTAYDTQKIRRFYEEYSHNADLAAKGSIFCALQLYLDFINMFLYILRIVGRRRND